MFSVTCSASCSNYCSKYLGKLMEWNGTDNDHVTVRKCSGLPQLQLQSKSSYRTRDTAQSHVIGNGGARFCVSNAHCMDCYSEGLTAKYRHIFNICYFKCRWAKSTSKKRCKSMHTAISIKVPMRQFFL